MFMIICILDITYGHQIWSTWLHDTLGHGNPILAIAMQGSRVSCVKDCAHCTLLKDSIKTAHRFHLDDMTKSMLGCAHASQHTHRSPPSLVRS